MDTIDTPCVKCSMYINPFVASRLLLLSIFHGLVERQLHEGEITESRRRVGDIEVETNMVKKKGDA